MSWPSFQFNRFILSFPLMFLSCFPRAATLSLSNMRSNGTFRRPSVKLREGYKWKRQLTLRGKLTMHTAFDRKDNKNPVGSFVIDNLKMLKNKNIVRIDKHVCLQLNLTNTSSAFSIRLPSRRSPYPRITRSSTSGTNREEYSVGAFRTIPAGP